MAQYRYLSNILRFGRRKFRSRWTLSFFFFWEIIFLIEDYQRKFFARNLTERDRDTTREVKVFIGCSFLNGIWSRLVRPRRTIERPVFIILFYSFNDYHPSRFTSITQQALRKITGRKKGRGAVVSEWGKSICNWWNYQTEFIHRKICKFYKLVKILFATKKVHLFLKLCSPSW